MVTRFELRNNGDGSASMVQSTNNTPTGDHAPHFIGSKGKTWLTNEILAERGNSSPRDAFKYAAMLMLRRLQRMT